MELTLASLETDSDIPLSVIEAVAEVESLEQWETIKRIPDDLRGNSFFGEFDLWLFMAIEDDVTCFSCKVLDKIVFTGLELRAAFQYLRIADVNTILALVHPNCRCVLLRITNVLDYIHLGW